MWWSDKTEELRAAWDLMDTASVFSGEETPVGPALTDAWNVWDSTGKAPIAERGESLLGAAASQDRVPERLSQLREKDSWCVCLCVLEAGRLA